MSMDNVRSVRQYMLEVFVDYFQKPLIWADLSATEQQDLKDYRQALLDWPDTIQGIFGEDRPVAHAEHQPAQPTWFADKHPMGRIYT
tara:strand:- start:13 stop:273 length:261 start_codon:yes stop_codon:yes gene_type:complete